MCLTLMQVGIKYEAESNSLSTSESNPRHKSSRASLLPALEWPWQVNVNEL